MKTRQKKIADKIAQMPISFKATYKRATEGKSLRACINAQCQECCYYQIQEVRNCTSFTCPLYAVRPYQLPQGSLEDQDTPPESTYSAKERGR